MLSPVDGLDSWRDGSETVELIADLRDGDYFDDFPGASDVADHLEIAAVAMLESAMTSDGLEKISDATEEWRHHLTDRLFRAHDEAVRYEIENVGTIVEDIGFGVAPSRSTSTRSGNTQSVSTSSLNRYRRPWRRSWTASPSSRKRYVSSSPSFGSGKQQESDRFDDEALRSLFLPLLQR
ncbi:hypothetical protein [Bradyrhizobium sp. I1.7.5]|uniref:hypothetical protein n=1 Tax=Bradyrhizobium sp. I1.7.5 TaxID=3156363 RepID=UPI0033971666